MVAMFWDDDDGAVVGVMGESKMSFFSQLMVALRWSRLQASMNSVIWGEKKREFECWWNEGWISVKNDIKVV
jgi:hypothetical protein